MRSRPRRFRGKPPEPRTLPIPGITGRVNHADYAKSIDAFPDGRFQIIVVDGRARPSCIEHAIPKLDNSGVLILDNSERSHYRPIQQHLRDLGFAGREYFGLGPYNWEPWATTFWQNPRRRT
jgi:hypothetical protein